LAEEGGFVQTKEEYNEYMRLYMLRRYHDLLGGMCTECSDTSELEFDHIDRTKKTGELAKMWSYNWDDFIDELTKCQLLCRDCHIDKTKEDMGVPHGGGKAGKFLTLPSGKRQACSCVSCTKQRNKYSREYKRSKRKPS
jgi:hypothetical protein